VLGRLFQRLEQRIESRRGEHVHFVDDVNLEASPAGADVDIAAELADFIDAAVARAVNFKHIEVATNRNSEAVITYAAGRGGRPVHAVQRLGEDAGRRCFADAASAGEEIGVANTVGGDGIGEGLRDLVLADELTEILRAIPARYDHILRIAAVGVARHVIL